MAIQKILVANRGEIAVRIMRTAQGLGYETVAVFSEADKGAPHVQLADQAVLLGSAEVGESYLNGERILAAARKVGADAIHPGYGFLSENGEFAQAVIEAGLTWIGPSPEAMAVMGNKGAAKKLVEETAVATVPGYFGDDQSDEAFISAANGIGFPVMVKAAAGGGGRGMRAVDNAIALPTALAGARSEALKAFGSDELLLEKGIVNPRHIEVQVFGDMQGNVIHLGERDCSIQRRHQKVVEEAPSPAVDEELRVRLGEAAVLVAKAVGYYGAGTVEFLLNEANEFYFIEMNTRLQVEHPVTELVTGLDLVAWQLLVAEGRPLPLTQAEVVLCGHAIEVRLYAEEPQNDFLPSTGRVHLWKRPSGEGVRVDDGLQSGVAITPYYDAMVAKVIAFGATRAVARRRLRRALLETAVFGVQTNRNFLLETIEHPTFTTGEATTQFIAEMGQLDASAISSKVTALAGILFYQRNLADDPLWNWRSRPFSVCFDGEMVRVTAVSSNRYYVDVAGNQFEIASLEQRENSFYFEVEGVWETAVFAFEPDGKLWLQLGAETVTFFDTLLAPPQNEDTVGSGNVLAPMPGSVMRLDVNVGDAVLKGQSLLILEAMKMEHTIVAPFDGDVTEILVAKGQQMQPKQLMLVVKPEYDEQ